MSLDPSRTPQFPPHPPRNGYVPRMRSSEACSRRICLRRPTVSSDGSRARRTRHPLRATMRPRCAVTPSPSGRQAVRETPRGGPRRLRRGENDEHGTSRRRRTCQASPGVTGRCSPRWLSAGAQPRMRRRPQTTFLPSHKFTSSLSARICPRRPLACLRVVRISAWRNLRISSITMGLLGMSSKASRSRGAKIGW